MATTQPVEAASPRIAVQAACPGCGEPTRIYDTETRSFGCRFCSYTSDERNA